MHDLSCFKTYDIRGPVPGVLTAALAHDVGRAFAALMGGPVVIGRDARASGPALSDALAGGLCAQGVDVLDLGPAGTEEVYFAVSHLKAAGGITVTASHNPADQNGLKFVGPESRPVDPESTFQHLREMVRDCSFPAPNRQGQRRDTDTRDAYAARVAASCEAAALRPLHLLVNAGNGMAGPAFDAILDRLQSAGARLRVTRINHAPDSRFPKGVPNPLLPENRPETAQAVRDAGADIGIAWDGDFDRCFLFDETGAFVDGQYLVGLLAAATLQDEPGATIVHDRRVMWNAVDRIEAAGGRPVPSKTGHTWFKQIMRQTGAPYGGEMSAHHYFREFMYCDSGMIPWIKVAALMSASGQPLSALVGEMRAKFPSSGERNFAHPDPVAAMARIESVFAGQALNTDRSDGLSLEFADWRLNIRRSATESLLRLNLETRGDAALLARRLADCTELIEESGREGNGCPPPGIKPSSRPGGSVDA